MQLIPLQKPVDKKIKACLNYGNWRKRDSGDRNIIGHDQTMEMGLEIAKKYGEGGDQGGNSRKDIENMVSDEILKIVTNKENHGSNKREE